MAFGFGFNKQKVLSAAEKFVQQGKLQNAISEYEKILKHDPKDLTVMNTVGDLYSRLGETDKAAECFKNVGDAYAGQGFTVKAIAMYKKLSKLKASMECVLRLAELYTQQGLFNDARAQYLLVAEDFLKTGQLEQAVRIFQKTLEMDPDNVAMRSKLAEVYVKLGKKDEAWKILSAAAESLRSKGQLAAADEVLQRMLKLEPGNTYALVLRGKAAVESGDFAAAIQCLSKVPDLDSNPEGLRALFHAYLRAKKLAEALTTAEKIANVHSDLSAVNEYCEQLMESQQYGDVLQVFDQFSDGLLRADPEKFIANVRATIGPVKDDTHALQTVLQLFQKAGETAHITEVYELLAHAYVQGGDLESAREYYLKLTQLEPGNAMHAQNYQQVLEKQGTGAGAELITAEEGAVLADELEATAPVIDQRYDDETALAVRSALTDAELFISYNMPAKALGPLISALPKAPRDLRVNQKLAALYTRAGKFAEAAVCLRTLESIYHDAGHADEAARYGDLAAKYEARTGAASAASASPVSSTPAASVGVQEFEVAAPVHDPELNEAAVMEHKQSAPKPEVKASGLFFHGAAPTANSEPKPEAAPSAAAEFAVPTPDSRGSQDVPDLPVTSEGNVSEPAEVQEDLSSEWEQDFSVESPAVAQPDAQSAADPAQHSQPATQSAGVEESKPVEHAAKVDDAIEEVRFYLGQGMIDQAEQVLAKAESQWPDSPELAVLRLGVDSAKLQPVAEPQPEIEVAAVETDREEVAVVEPSTIDAEEPSAPEPVAAEEVASVHETAHAADQIKQPWPSERPVLQEIVSEIEQSLGDGFLDDTPAAVQPEPEPVSAQASAPQFRAGTLDEFVSDLEASLGNDFPSAPAGVEADAAAQVRQQPVSPVRVEQPTAAARASQPTAFAAAAGSGTVPITTSLVPPVAASDAVAAVDLSDMFGDLKQELEDSSAQTDEDPETHYNLGVAFREMGLLDEAIGEFQKVCQAAEHGRSFPQIMQTYTWLAQCFLDKGVPEAAVRWYEKALKIPSLDVETRTAVQYELASSLETAGNRPAALSNFLEVYGSNIDYRDVAERIKALRT